MIVFPNCKINLGLRVLRKRNDGYHDLESVFYPIPLCDVLELVRAAEPSTGLRFSTSGTVIEDNGGNNLCVKAYKLLQKHHPDLPAAMLHLHKAIPTGAGLGGGSADAAFTLKLLNEKFRLQLTAYQLIDYAAQLGSDCPFFIINKPAFAESRGEILETISLDLSIYKFVVVNPGIHISTAKAFSRITPALPAKSPKEIIQQPIETWKDDLINDFEKPVFHEYPEIETIKNNLYDSGALYAAMSGSGSTVYSIFRKEANVSLDFPSHYYLRELNG